ncbi:MAG: SIS domain-containing protein [Nitrospirota bacterium]
MPAAFLTNYVRELNNIVMQINLKEFETFIEELLSAFERQSQIFIFGNGGSAATSSHFACDINKGVSYGKDRRFKIICLNDNLPIIMAYANDVSYNDIFVEQLKNFMNEDDLSIGVSGSGNSINVLKAIEYANNNGGKTFGVCGYGGGRLKEISQKSIVIQSNDMQKVEDLLIIIFHCAMQYLINNIIY